MNVKRELYTAVSSAQDTEKELDDGFSAIQSRNRSRSCLWWLYLITVHILLVLFAVAAYVSWVSGAGQVGMYSLTEEEYTKLDIATSKAVNKPEQRLVTIEVFHQLHCLNYLRRRIYEDDGKYFQVESDWSGEAHLSHCIDYLRQVLMCQADLTLITLELAPHKYKPNFSIAHSCRNWDRIYEFAEARNISGTGIE